MVNTEIWSIRLLDPNGVLVETVGFYYGEIWFVPKKNGFGLDLVVTAQGQIEKLFRIPSYRVVKKVEKEQKEITEIVKDLHKALPADLKLAIKKDFDLTRLRRDTC